MEIAGRLHNMPANLATTPLTRQTYIYCQALWRPGGYKCEDDGNLYSQRAHLLFTIGVVLSSRNSGNLWGIFAGMMTVSCQVS